MSGHDAAGADSSSATDIDLVAASLRADAADTTTFTEVLAAKLEEALPGGVRVDRVRRGLFGPRQVQAIAVDAGDERLQLRVEGGVLETSCARVSGGIVLRTEAVDTDTWLRRLGAALTQQAQRSQTTRQALERLLNG